MLNILFKCSNLDNRGLVLKNFWRTFNSNKFSILLLMFFLFALNSIDD